MSAGPEGAARQGRLTTVEAARLLDIWPDSVSELAKRGRIAGVKVDGRWRLSRGSVMRYLRTRSRRPWSTDMTRHLPADPLLRLIEGRGGRAACGVVSGSAEERALDRAQGCGWLTLRAADELAVRLVGLTVEEVWGPCLV